MDIVIILILIIFLIYVYETGKFLLDYKFIIVIVILGMIVYDPSFLKDFMVLFYSTNRKKNNPYNSFNKTTRRSVSNGVKKMVASNQLWRCKSCNMLLNASYEVDHIIPLYKGGSNEIYNLQALCRNCHGNKTLMDKYM